MKVRAIAKGYYGGQIRNIGDVFDVPDAVAGAWFVAAHDGFNPTEPDNHAPEDGLGAEGLNPIPEVNPENAEKKPETGNIFPEKTGEIPENQAAVQESDKGKRK